MDEKGRSLGGWVGAAPVATEDQGSGGGAGRTQSARGGDAGSDEMLSPVSTLRVNKQKLGPPDPPQTAVSQALLAPAPTFSPVPTTVPNSGSQGWIRSRHWASHWALDWITHGLPPLEMSGKTVWRMSEGRLGGWGRGGQCGPLTRGPRSPAGLCPFAPWPAFHSAVPLCQLKQFERLEQEVSQK